MEENQKINCSVDSCEYNDTTKRTCELDQITVEPNTDTHTGTPEESMCGSYVKCDCPK